MLGLILLVIVSILILLLIVAYFAHVFTPIEVKEEVIAPVKIVFATHVGPYSKACINYDFVEKELSKANNGKEFKENPLIGIYYDKPTEVKAENLRSAIGKIVDDNTIIPELPDGKIKSLTLNLGKVLVIHFPYSSFLDIFSGIFRCYPLMQKYLDNHKDITIAHGRVELVNYVPNRISYIAAINERGNILDNFPN